MSLVLYDDSCRYIDRGEDVTLSSKMLRDDRRKEEIELRTAIQPPSHSQGSHRNNYLLLQRKSRNFLINGWMVFGNAAFFSLVTNLVSGCG